MNRINNIFRLIKEIYNLPKVKITFKNYNESTVINYKKTFKYFNKLHRTKLFRNKTLGVALIDLNLYESFEDYYKSINGKNSAAYYQRKALKRGYKFQEINRNDFVDDIYEVNTSAEIRQGRKMNAEYLKKVNSYKEEENYKYWGGIK